MKIKLWVTLVGILIGAIAYWRIPYAKMNMLELNNWLFVGAGTLIGAFLSTLAFKLDPWKAGLRITLGVILSVIIRIIYDTTFWDSTSHNLAPLEIIYAAFQSFPMAFVGAFLAKFINNPQKNSCQQRL